MNIRKLGLSTLKTELGAVGAACFIREYVNGSGDYAAERYNLLEGMTLNDIINKVREMDKQ
jgi:hypothetical protein